MMIAVDPVQSVERQFAEALQRLHRELLDLDDSVVHAHLDGDALVCVIEGLQMSAIDPTQRVRLHARVGELIGSVLRRRQVGEMVESWPHPNLHVSVLRLSPPGSDPASGS